MSGIIMLLMTIMYATGDVNGDKVWPGESPFGQLDQVERAYVTRAARRPG